MDGIMRGDFDEDEYDDELDEDDDEFFDCQMDRNGMCGKAGSEECDFECPIMADIHRAEALRRKKYEELSETDRIKIELGGNIRREP